MGKIIFLISGIEFNSAPFNRFITIVKTVNLAGFNYEILDIKPSARVCNNDFEKVDQTKILYDGILIESIYHPGNSKQNFVNKVKEKINEKVYIFKALKKRNENDGSVLYLNSIKISDYLYFFILSKLFHFKYVHERSEYPKLIRKQSYVNSLLYKFFLLPWCYKVFDGMVIMTEPLIKFYSKYTRRTCKIVNIPMSVDPDRFKINVEKTEKYIGYVGSLNNQKDGLDILIKAFSIVSRDFPSWCLKIVGVAKNETEKTILIDLIESLNLIDRVKLLGGKTREEVPEFLKKASLLILARPESKQAEGGFPTKLGEYLMTGNPVIVTDVGEISKFLENKKDAYIIKPGDINILADTIKQALINQVEAKLIGQQGMQTALFKFDYKSHSVELKKFFNLL